MWLFARGLVTFIGGSLGLALCHLLSVIKVADFYGPPILLVALSVWLVWTVILFSFVANCLLKIFKGSFWFVTFN